MSIAELVQILTAKLGIDPLEKGAEGEYHIFIDDMRVALLEDRDGWIWLRGEAGTVPQDSAERFLQQLLQWNFGRVRKQEATLSLDPDGSRLWLHQRLSASSLQAEEVVQIVGRFVNALEFWRRRLAENVPAETPRGPLPFLIR